MEIYDQRKFYTGDSVSLPEPDANSIFIIAYIKNKDIVKLYGVDQEYKLSELCPPKFKIGQLIYRREHSKSCLSQLFKPYKGNAYGIIKEISISDRTILIELADGEAIWVEMQWCDLVSNKKPDIETPIPFIVGDYVNHKNCSITYKPFGRVVERGKLGFVRVHVLGSEDIKVFSSSDLIHVNYHRTKEKASLDVITTTLTQVPLSAIKQENTMSLKFETQHFINNKLVEHYSVEDLITVISNEEKAIEELKRVKHMPNAVLTEIDRREKELERLVEFLNAK